MTASEGSAASPPEAAAPGQPLVGRPARRLGPRLLRLAITVGVLTLLALFARRVDWGATWAAVVAADPLLLLIAMVVNLFSAVLKGVRWWMFLRPAGAPSLWLAIRASLAGAGLNNVLIANGGDAARVILVARTSGVPTSRVVATLALERLFELVGYVAMLALAVALLPMPALVERSRPVAYLALAAVVALLAYLVRLRPGGELSARRSPGFRGSVGHFLRSFRRTVAALSTPRRFTGALALSLLTWGLQVATYHLTALSAALPITVSGTVAALIAVNIGFALRATPGNVGLFQVMYAAAATALGLNADHAVAVAFLIQTQQVLPITVLGLLAAPELLRRRPAPPPPDAAEH